MYLFCNWTENEIEKTKLAPGAGRRMAEISTTHSRTGGISKLLQTKQFATAI